MFSRAVKAHNAVAPSRRNPTIQQQSLNQSFKTQIQATRPLTTGSGNVGKHNAVADHRTPGQAHGIKRTSSGLAKALSSQNDDFDYSRNLFDDDDSSFGLVNEQKNTNGQTPVYFDENDFDSDIDLEVEDPASKGTIHYPTLPMEPAASGDFTYKPTYANIKSETGSSQPIPWSSSPIEHLKTPPKPHPQPPRSKRRTLPWLQDNPVEVALDPEPEAESEPEAKPKKRKSDQGFHAASATPVQKETAKSAYPWNTTASAIKQQQKNLREANKMMKANEATDDDVKKAISKKKKNAIHRIFLSEEQQHVLNLCVEYKKSVFFTGSAGKGLSFCSSMFLLTV